LIVFLDNKESRDISLREIQSSRELAVENHIQTQVEEVKVTKEMGTNTPSAERKKRKKKPSDLPPLPHK
jgi:hypothetical protein